MIITYRDKETERQRDKGTEVGDPAIDRHFDTGPPLHVIPAQRTPCLMIVQAGIWKARIKVKGKWIKEFLYPLAFNLLPLA